MEAHLEKYTEGEVILIDKDYRWTSFDVVKKIRNTVHVKKVGHAGTLDPLATGLLIVCTGRMTKQIQTFQDLPKEYAGAFFLGATRPSDDKETGIDQKCDISNLTAEKIEEVAQSFQGRIDQIPPAYSAVRKGGKRVYELARKGKEVVLGPRKVEIFRFEITKIELPIVEFVLRCSKGFYVRSLARDFGKRLACGAYLDRLRRMAIGDYRVEDALSIEEFVNCVKV
jgi:tRNA pseudouridine55 synthase